MSEKDHTSQAHDVGCLEAIEGLYAWLDGELKDVTALKEIEQHIAHCHSCYSRAEIEQILTRRIRESVGEAGPGAAPESLQRRLGKLMDSF